MVSNDQVATQFYGTTNDEIKLVLWYAEVWQYHHNNAKEDDHYDIDLINDWGDDGVYYGPEESVEYSCILDSLIVGPGAYKFSFDVAHPCISESSKHERRFLLQKYHVDSMNYQIMDPETANDQGVYVGGAAISEFDSLGYEKNFE